MKITLFLLLFVTFQAYCENGYSQSAKISIPRSTLKVSELLTQIESQTDYLFVYNKKSVDTKRVVNVDATNQPVSEILDKAFEGTGIHYVVEGNNIVLTKNITCIHTATETNYGERCRDRYERRAYHWRQCRGKRYDEWYNHRFGR